MKNQKFEIAVAGYDYRFKTYARDGVEASVKVKCFLGRPDAECSRTAFRDTVVQDGKPRFCWFRLAGLGDDAAGEFRFCDRCDEYFRFFTASAGSFFHRSG